VGERRVVGAGVIAGERIVDAEAFAFGSGDEFLELEMGTLGIEDGLEDVGEDAGASFGDLVIGEGEEDGVESVGDGSGGVEIVGARVEEVGETLGRAFGEVVLAERLGG